MFIGSPKQNGRDKMSWIAVHDDVLGGKLRGLRKKLNCSEAEALGLLTYLWLWARKNADRNGLLLNTDVDDIEDVVKPILSYGINSHDAVTSLIETGWLDDLDGSIYVHDWFEWQSFWYAYLDKKEKDRERKKVSRENQHKKEVEKKKPAKEKTKEPKPEKIEFAEAVKMLQSEYDKLAAEYGEDFTKKCIEELSNYKLSSGKKVLSH